MHSILSSLWPKKWPSKQQWKKLPQVLNRKEKIGFSLLVVVTLAALFHVLFGIYDANTKIVPAKGGSYTEGVVESTRWLTINPLYSQEGDAESSLTEIAFEGLMKYNEKGELVPNLAKDYHTEDDRVFEVILREDLYWSDGERMTASDIKFTVETIKNPDFGSPLRQEWEGVEIEKLSETDIRFTLENPSSVFSDNLTLKPIPEHIFAELSPSDLRYSIYNVQPVGSGPYRFRETEERPNEEIRRITFERNPYYFKEDPYLDEVSFLFFDNEEDLLRAKNRGEVDGYALPEGAKEAPERGFEVREFEIPRYFSIIFNIESEGALNNKNVRKALKYATDKQQVLEQTLGEKGKVVKSPLFTEFYDLPDLEEPYTTDLEKAKELLEEEGFENGMKEPEEVFEFTEEMKLESQGEEVRRLQECFMYLTEEDEDLYPEGEVTGFFNEETEEAVNYFQEKHSEEILDPHGFSSGTGMVAGSTQDKLNKECEELFAEEVALEITITTLESPVLLETVREIEEQWEELGVEVEIKRKSFSEIQESIIRERDFEALLYGTMLSRNFDPFPLWHSSKTEHPGLNLSNYENEDVDEMIESYMNTEKDAKETAKELQKKILEDAPGIFLYNPYFLYSVSDHLKGIEEGRAGSPSERFENIEEWYKRTQRTLE